MHKRIKSKAKRLQLVGKLNRELSSSQPTLTIQPSMNKRNIIRQWIADGEGPTLDFKLNITSPPKIARNLVAFANSRGGKIVIGVEDNGRIIGINADEQQYNIELAAERFCAPNVLVEFEPYEVEGKTLLIVHVSESSRKPHYALDKKGEKKVYVRISDACVEPNALISEVLMKGDLNFFQRNMGIHNLLRTELVEYLQANKTISIPDYMQMRACNERNAKRTLIDFLLEGTLRLTDDQLFMLGKA